ncbi:MAG TPA: hypothetical protein PL070_08890 [Flavobacteriales bacterium]|nr:hypothetical protein [Flavobacteriales bacterium]
MRAFIHRHTWLTYLVLAVFLLATSGTVLSRMTCLEGGHSVLSLGAATDCCPEEEHTSDVPTYKATCCELAMVQGEGDDYLPNNSADLLFVEAFLSFHTIEVTQPEPVVSFTWLRSRPPPLAVSDRLAVISVQRV